MHDNRDLMATSLSSLPLNAAIIAVEQHSFSAGYQGVAMHTFLLFTLDNSSRAGSSDGIASRSSDRELIESIARADREAMRLLFLRFKTPIYRFALRLGADVDVAEEIVSEVFFDVWRSASNFEGRSAVLTWLLAITRNKAMAQMRRRPTASLDDDDAKMIEDESEAPEATLQKHQVRAILLEALKRLTPAHREIIDLVYYHGRSIEEVARILDIPKATVKTRMFYARSRLAQVLAQGGQDKILQMN